MASGPILHVVPALFDSEDGETRWRAVFSRSNNGSTPPTVVDLPTLHSGELREIRRLTTEIEAFKAPYGLKTGDETETVESLKAVADAVLAAGQKGVEISRYKGLGEMDASQLWETTMDPERRTLLKVNVHDAVEADRMFTTLMGDEVEPRREFIEKNARFVSNLDI